MLSEIFSAYPIIFTIIWQSSLFIAAGIMASYFCKRHPARAHQVLLLSMIAAVAVPLMTLAVKHLDLGIFMAEPEPAVEYVATEYAAVSEISIQPNNNPLPGFAPSVPFESEKTGLPWRKVLLTGWVAASVIFLARLILTFILGIRVVKKAQPFDYPLFEKSIKAASSKLGIKEDVVVFSSKSVSSPVIWCWKRSPILLFPFGKRILSEKRDLVGILCHELAHLKRRDHVAGLLSELMVVFLPWHPLLWWAKKRLLSLSEQACDDWVMAEGGCGTNYAESLLDFLPTKQMAFVPAVVRNKNILKGRVMRILKGRYGNPRLSKRWILSAVIITTCISLMVACAQTRSSRSEENLLPQKATNAGPSFGDATIMASNPNEPGKAFLVEGSRFRTVNTTALELLTSTFGIHAKQLENAPAWLELEKYNIEAELDTSGAPNDAQLKKMLEKLLADRMNLKFHKEEREVLAYVLEVAKDGPKLDKSDAGPNSLPGLFFSGPGVLNVRNANMTDFSHLMQEAVLDRPVVDRTGLQGRWNFTLKWTLDEAQSAKFADMGEMMPPASDAADPPPQLFTAIQQQIGLKFSSEKAQVPVIVIDHIEKPVVDLTAPAARAQATAQDPNAPAYRNVSIQLASAGPGERGSILFNPGFGGLEIRGQTLRFVIAEAYGVNEAQVVGRDWDNEPHYNITADGLKASQSTSGTEFASPSEMYGPALRELLADKFGLVTSSEKGQLDGYALMIGNGEPKLTVGAAGPGQHTFQITPEGLKVTSLPLSEVTKFLSSLLGGLVVDQTGLKDNFNFEVKLSMPMSPNTPPDPAAIAKAMEQQLGLKIEAKKLDVDVVKVVNLKPSEEVVTGPPSASDKTAAFDQTKSAPHPGTEAALRRHLEGLEKKQPVTEEMAPGLVAAVEQQWPQLEGAFESFGALKSVTFTGNERGNDVYNVDFEHATTIWTIGPLIDGKVSTLFFRTVVKRDDKGPSPGLADAIRRELEGSLAGEPAYEIMSPALQAATREQWSMISADAKRLGAVQDITFQNINDQGWDVYHVTFANGTATIMAEPLVEGKLNGLLHTDIRGNRDGNEANDPNAPAYRNVSIQLASAGPGEMGSILFNPGFGGLEIRGQTLRFVIAEAYGVNEAQVVGRDWDNEPHYNITADGLKASKPTGDSAFESPSAMFGAALRELLAEEFGLVTSSEQGQLDGYALLISDGEPKLTVSAANAMGHFFHMSPEGFGVTSLPLSEVTKFLSSLLGGLVVDQTGLQGNFDFEVKLPMPMSPNTPPDPAAIAKAMEQQLGLKIEAKKLNVDVVKVVNLKPPAEVVTDSPL